MYELLPVTHPIPASQTSFVQYIAIAIHTFIAISRIRAFKNALNSKISSLASYEIEIK